MWAGLNEEGTSWLALFDERYEIRNTAEFPFQAVSFHFRIHGNTISFEPVIPSDCTTSRCREAAAWSVTVALAGKTWRRVG